MGAASAAEPPKQIAASDIHPNGIEYTLVASSLEGEIISLCCKYQFIVIEVQCRILEADGFDLLS